MGSELIESLFATCALTLDTFDAIRQNIKMNNLHRNPKKLLQFFKTILNKRPLLKVEGASRRETIELTKFTKKIHKQVVSDLISWAKKTGGKGIIKHLCSRIKELKLIMANSKSAYGENKNSKKSKTEYESDEDSENDSDYDDTYEDDEDDYDDDEESFQLDTSDEEDDEFSDSEKEYETDEDDVEEEEDDEEDEDDEENSDDESVKKSKKFQKNKDKNRDKKNVKKIENYLRKMKTKMNEGTIAYINSYKKMSKDHKTKIIKELDKFGSCKNTNNPLMYRVLLSNIPDTGKQDILNRMKQSRQDDSSKFREWLESILSIPFDKYEESHVNPNSSKSTIKNFLSDTRECLDDAVHGHEEAKQKIMQFIAQTISNKSPNGLVLGIEGPMGNGKTTLVEKGLAKAMKRPFVTIPLGGIQDGSFLEGHGYTYEGSRWGAIVNSLIVSGCMNPVIYMDELDKVSQTHHGHEIINLLIHLVDPSQNHHFRDKYFAGINFDLSRATFIFSYNDSDQINPVLMDRITHLKTRGFRLAEKIIISQKYLLKSILKDVGIDETQIKFSDDVLEWIIDNYTHEGGVRELKKILYEIVREINLRNLSTKSIKLPYTIEKSVLEKDYFKKMRPYRHEKIHKKSLIGKINGLYATCNDTGGIIVIEAVWVPSDSKLKLELTGRQGNVMKESMQVAKTLSWKMIPEDIKEKWNKEWKSEKGFQGIHVHCPEGGVPKDGPSAGAAITTAMYSLMSGRPIRNNIGITGEIDLSGKVLEIGGLESKIFGAIAAGCKKVLCPVGNQKDLDRILDEHGDVFKKKKFEVKTVSNIKEVFENLLK